MIVRGVAGWKSVHSYGPHHITGGLYKVSVSIWIFLGLASFASVIATMQDTYTSIVGHVGDKAVQLKEMAGIGSDKREFGRVSRSKRRVEPADSDGQTKPDTDVDNYSCDRIQID